MKIKILSCINPEYWYANKIGEILEVEKYTQDNGSIVYEYHGKDENGNFNGLFHLKDIIEI